MSLAIWAKGGLVLLAGSAISGTVVGFTKLSPSTYSGSGVATRPRLVIARGKGANAELSFNYDSFLGGGYQEGQEVPFNKVGMKFGDYQLKEGDLLCSLEQKGEYFVLRLTGKKDPYSRLPTYSAEGYPTEVTGCDRRKFSQTDKLNSVKKVKLTGFRPEGTTWNSGAGVSTIYVSNCYFSLQKTQRSNFGSIMASKCTTGSQRKLGSNIQTSPIIPEYEVN